MGKEIILESFVLSGDALVDDKKQIAMFVHNSSVDEMCVYKDSLTIVVEDKLRQTLTEKR